MTHNGFIWLQVFLMGVLLGLAIATALYVLLSSRPLRHLWDWDEEKML